MEEMSNVFFETAYVDTLFFLNNLFWKPIKTVAKLALLVFIAWIILRSFLKLKNIGPVKKIPYFSFLCVKLILSGYITAIVFFYDFSRNQFVWGLPEKMLLSTMLVGLLSAYEVISCIFSMIEYLSKNDADV